MVQRSFIARLLRADDANLLPFRVRTFIGLHLVFGSLLFIGFWLVLGSWPRFVAGVATAGILCALTGSASLIWESSLSEADAARVSNEILRGGKTKNLSEGEVGFVIFTILIVVLFFLLAAPIVAHKYRQSGSEVFVIKSVASFTTFAVFAGFVTYCTIKLPKLWLFRRAECIRSASQSDQFIAAKAVLRGIGFGLIWAGALLQVPLAITS